MSPRILTGQVFLPKQRHRHNLPLDTGQIDVALKILLTMAFLANALLKFIRVHRLFGYSAIPMAAILNEHEHPEAMHPEAMHRAAQTAEINGTAPKATIAGGARSVSHSPRPPGFSAPSPPLPYSYDANSGRIRAGSS